MTSLDSHSLRTLGNSDLHLSAIGFGAWAIGGGDWTYAWGPQDDNESIAAIHRALELGVNWIDTAAIYGLGHSEEVVARALKSASSKPYVFTKCGIRWDANRTPYRSLKAASVSEELENSLRRLGVETIDLYQIHWPDPESEIEEAWETLARFRKQGKVRWIGVSNFTVEQMKRVREIDPITSLQPPYSMLRPAIEAEILPFVRDNGIGRSGDSSFCPGQRHRRHQLFAHGFRPAHWEDDSRAHRCHARRRLAAEGYRIQGTATQPQSQARGRIA